MLSFSKRRRVWSLNLFHEFIHHFLSKTESRTCIEIRLVLWQSLLLVLFVLILFIIVTKLIKWIIDRLLYCLLIKISYKYVFFILVRRVWFRVWVMWACFYFNILLYLIMSLFLHLIMLIIPWKCDMFK